MKTFKFFIILLSVIIGDNINAQLTIDIAKITLWGEPEIEYESHGYNLFDSETDDPNDMEKILATRKPQLMVSRTVGDDHYKVWWYCRGKENVHIGRIYDDNNHFYTYLEDLGYDQSYRTSIILENDVDGIPKLQLLYGEEYQQVRTIAKLKFEIAISGTSYYKLFYYSDALHDGLTL